MNGDVSSVPGAAPDEPALDPALYHLIVAPVLQAAAELAAARGDPDLVNDLASMLALRTLVQRFGEFYLDAHAESPTPVRDAIRAAPAAACLMPLQRAELTGEPLRDCLWSLDAASRQLTDAGVIGPEVPRARVAWSQLLDSQRDEAMQTLKLAAAELISAIDRFERAREMVRDRAGARPL
ncbi:MAG TPA: hypothetical protein VFN09_02805 [Rhodanobacteraceae bacterium]|nr:hypothetical protein [Rhodanobacteraceae bacterium]